MAVQKLYRTDYIPTALSVKQHHQKQKQSTDFLYELNRRHITADFFVIYTIAFLRFYRISFFHTLIIITHSILIINMPNSKTDTEILMIRINERKNGMKKTAAILASIAAMSLCGLSASAADGDNIIDGVLNGAEEIVDGVVSGAEEIITPGGSTSVDESTNDSTAIPDTVSQVTPGDSTSSTGNVNTGVPAFDRLRQASQKRFFRQ